MARCQLCAVLLLVTAGAASAETVNFDDVVVPGLRQWFPGNTWAAKGVIFSTGNIPDAVGLGDTINFVPVGNEILIANNSNSISAPHFAAPSHWPQVDYPDMLMYFPGGVSSVELTIDDRNPESAEIVRLLGLVPTGTPNQFQVVDLAEIFDNEITAPNNLLRITPSVHVQYALFQVTTELEGFDDLAFQPMPEPGSSLLAMFAFVALVGIRWRRGR